jgi:hypothetical protein
LSRITVIVVSASSMPSTKVFNRQMLNLNLSPRLLLTLPISWPFLSSHDLRALNFLYLRIGKFIQKNSRRFVVLAPPQVRRRLHLALFLGLWRAYFLWWKQVLFDPKSVLEKMVKRGSINSAWFLLATIKGKAFARPQPVTQAVVPAPVAPGACSPLELVIGTQHLHAFYVQGTNNSSPRHHRASLSRIWHHCR